MDYEQIFIAFSVSFFASIIQFEICSICIPVFSARCFRECFAKSETVFIPERSSSSALFEPIPFISVKFDVFSGS